MVDLLGTREIRGHPNTPSRPGGRAPIILTDGSRTGDPGQITRGGRRAEIVGRAVDVAPLAPLHGRVDGTGAGAGDDNRGCETGQGRTGGPGPSPRDLRR